MDTKLIPTNDNHPSHDVYQGQMFMKEVYEALLTSPQWNQTLNAPNPEDIIGPESFLFKFYKLGVRVPTIFVSPWIKKGTWIITVIQVSVPPTHISE
ncbi:hypothetical protein ACLOJK_025868 [Asimina triloba]